MVVRIILVVVLLCALVSSALAENISIVDVYSDIDSVDIAIHSDQYYSSVQLDASLILEGVVLQSKRLKVGDINPGADVTKVLFWNVPGLQDGFYQTSVTLSVNGSIVDHAGYNFSYGSPSLPRIFIKDISSNSSGVSIILSPYVTLFGTEPLFADVEYMLIDRDLVVYRVRDSRVAVAQATPLTKNWNVLLENNHKYISRVKVFISLPNTRVFARSEGFTARDNARISEIYRDETGASATIVGLSQVPFNGSLTFTVSKDGRRIEEISKKSPILVLDDDETVEVLWSERLPPGLYGLSVRLIGNDRDIIDQWETIIEAENQGIVNRTSPGSAQTPGFTILLTLLSMLFFYLIRSREG